MGLPPMRHFLSSQILLDLPKPTKSFAGQTVIITGSNTGIGFECVKYMVQLHASKIIMAVRSLERGHAAASNIVKATGCSPDLIEVWELDLARYDSIKGFAARVNSPSELDRLDVLIGNAGILTQVAELSGDKSSVGGKDDEMTIKVNVLGTYLLNFLLLPKLRQTAERYETNVVLTMTGSWMHWTTDFPERSANDVFETLADVKNARMAGYERYSTSKLIQLLLYQEFVEHLTQPRQGRIITSVVNPGGVATDIVRDKQSWLRKKLIALQGKVMLRTAEEGARTVVYAAQGELESDGHYLCDCQPAPLELLSGFVKSDEAVQVRRKFWQQLLKRFELMAEVPGLESII